MSSAVIRTTTVAALTASPFQNITISGIGTPKAVMLIMTTLKSTDVVPADHKDISVGVTDGTFQGGYAALSRDAQANSATHRAGFDDAVIRMIKNDASGFDGVATFSSWITDGVTIAWSSSPSQDFVIQAIFWCGDDLSVKAGVAVPDILGNPSVDVTVGFEPQHLLTISNGTQNALDETITNQSDLQIGHVVNVSGAASVFLTCMQHRNNIATMEPTALLDNERLALGYRGGPTGPFTYFQSTALDATTPFTSTGFKVSTKDGTAGQTGPRFVYLAVKYGSKLVKLKEETTGNNSFTGYGFQPGFLMNVQTLSTASWGNHTEVADTKVNHIGFGAFNMFDSMSVDLFDQDGILNSNTSSNFNGVAIVVNDTATLVSLDADGFTVNRTVTGSPATKFLVFAIENEKYTGSGTGTLSLSAGSGSGSLTFSGEGSGSAPIGAGSGSGSEIFSGEGAATIPLPLGSGSGLLVFTGEGSGSFPLPTGSGSGKGPRMGCTVDMTGSNDAAAEFGGSRDLASGLVGGKNQIALLRGAKC